MRQHDDNQELMKRYLLGTLQEDEWQTVEERLLTDSEYFDELLLVEDELIEQYIGDDLPGQDRESFEQQFLTSPERRQKLSFAMALNRYAALAHATQETEPADRVLKKEPRNWFLSNILQARNPAPIYLLAASLLLFVAVAVWFALRDRQQQNLITITAALRPGVVRDSGEIKRIAVPSNTDVVQLQLELGTSDYKEYRAVIMTVDGTEVFKSGSLKIESGAQDKFVALNVPANLLRAGEYQVKLSGLADNEKFEDIEKYYFRVTRQ